MQYTKQRRIRWNFGMALFLILAALPWSSKAQTSVISSLSGSEVRLSEDVRVTHTMGEPAVRRVDGSAGHLVTEGFQQGVWKIRPSGRDQVADLQVYPNPAGSWVRIDFEVTDLQPDHVIILDLRGEPIHQAAIRDSGQYLDVSWLNPGTYILQSILAEGQRGPAVQLIKH